MEHSEKLDEIAAALSAAQSEFPTITKTHEGQLGNRKYKYADLADIKEATKGPLAKNGLAIVSAPEFTKDEFRLSSKILHKSGQWIGSTYPLPGGLTPQETGSAITYGRRYVVSALLDIVTEDDDDGAAATTAQAKKGNGAHTAQDEKPKGQPPKKEAKDGENLLPVDASELVTIEIIRVVRRPGTNKDGSKWTRYGIEFRTEQMDNAEWLNTFSDTFGNRAKELLDSGQLANAFWKKGKEFNGKPSFELLHIESA